MLIGEDLEQVPVVPAGLLAPGGDAALGGGLAARQIEGQASQEGQVVGGVTGADTVCILPEGHVQDPVEGVLNPPVAAHGLQQDPRIGRQTGNVGAGFRGDLVPLSPLGLDHNQSLQVGPDPVGIHIAGVCRCPEHPAAACLNAAVVLVHGLVAVVVAALETLGLFDGEGFDHGLVQLGLVSLERQHIVGSPVADRLCNPLLAALQRQPGLVRPGADQQLC